MRARIPVDALWAAAAAPIGQVFGVAADDGKDAAAKIGAPIFM